MFKNNQNIKICCLIGATFCINGLLIGLLVLPLQSRIFELNNQILTSRKKIYSEQAQQQELIISGRYYQELQRSGLSEINQIFIKKNELLNFLDRLETLAEQNNIAQQIQLNESMLNDEANWLNLTLAINGNYSEVISYLSALEREDFYLNYSSLGLQTSGATEFNQVTDNSDQLQLQLQGIIYWLK